MQIPLGKTNFKELVINRTTSAFGDKIGVFGKLFGCWHKRISRPFKNYLTCLDCGARQPFDAQNLKANGSFYHPPTISRH